jgi:hypothetical protein
MGKLLKILQMVSSIAALAPGAAGIVASAVVSVQHMLPGSTGAQKKQAAVELVSDALTALDAASPSTGAKVSTAAGGFEDVVQRMFDVIQTTTPEVLLVHPDNKADAAASVPQGQQAAGNQPTTTRTPASSSGSGTGSASDELAQARARVAQLEAQQNNAGAGTQTSSTGAPQ